MPDTPNITLRPTLPTDLPALFALQVDQASNDMAGTKPYSAEAYAARWEANFKNPALVPRVIVLDGRVIGSIACFQNEGRDCVGYWIDKAHWGRGIAGRALALLLAEVSRRPLHATAAKSNTASIRALRSNGFRHVRDFAGEETDRYTAREVSEFVLE